MKKILLCGVSALFLAPAGAQLANPGFESRRPDGTPAFWMARNEISISIDPNCTNQGMDSLLITTTDAHTGSYACELRVGTSCGTGYSGSIRPTYYNTDSGFLDQRLRISRLPAAITFYYKLYAVQGDAGVAEAVMGDEPGALLGTGSVRLAPASVWTRATLPMRYSRIDSGGFLRLNFRIHNDTMLHYGSRFLIDDVALTAPAGIAGPVGNNRALTCYPSPAASWVACRLPETAAGTAARLAVTDIAGRTVYEALVSVPQDRTFRVDTRSFSPGTYFLRLGTGDGIYTGRFVK